METPECKKNQHCNWAGGRFPALEDIKVRPKPWVTCLVFSVTGPLRLAEKRDTKDQVDQVRDLVQSRVWGPHGSGGSHIALDDFERSHGTAGTFLPVELSHHQVVVISGHMSRLTLEAVSVFVVVWFRTSNSLLI